MPATTGLLYQPRMTDDDCGAVSGMSAPQIPRLDLGSNSDHHDGKLATNCQKYYMAMLKLTLVLRFKSQQEIKINVPYKKKKVNNRGLHIVPQNITVCCSQFSFYLCTEISNTVSLRGFISTGLDCLHLCTMH
jgi:hypothetical protein